MVIVEMCDWGRNIWCQYQFNPKCADSNSWVYRVHTLIIIMNWKTDYKQVANLFISLFLRKYSRTRTANLWIPHISFEDISWKRRTPNIFRTKGNHKKVTQKNFWLSKWMKRTLATCACVHEWMYCWWERETKEERNSTKLTSKLVNDTCYCCY